MANLKAFNPRSYKRSDIEYLYSTTVSSSFNPRSYKRSDVSVFQIIINCGLFQSTLLQEERHTNLITFFLLFHFQSTLLQEERLLSFPLSMPICVFQSTLLQEERPSLGIPVAVNGMLSIHAPTRGATCEILKLTPDYFAFNPRSYKRSDGIYPGSNILLASFNPRSYKRSDRV